MWRSLPAVRETTAGAGRSNRVMPDLFYEHGRDVFDRLQRPGPAAPLEEVAGAKVTTVLEATRLALARSDVAAEHLTSLAERLPDGLPRLQVPELFTRATGRRAVQQVAEHLDESLAGDT